MLFIDMLFGSVFIMAGGVMLLFPPKNINYFYGYRTPRSMKSRDAWKEGNNYAAKLLVISGIIAILLALICGHLIPDYSRYVVLGVILLSLLLCIWLTELRLKKLFDENGNRK